MSKVYVAAKYTGCEGHSAPLAVFDNIEAVKLFVAGFAASFDSGLRIYELDINRPNSEPLEFKP